MSVSAEEVAKHNTDKDCWVIVGDQVLDVTEFLSEHPGGKKSIMMFAGKDATEEFDMLHDRKVIKKYGLDEDCGQMTRRMQSNSCSAESVIVLAPPPGHSLACMQTDTYLPPAFPTESTAQRTPEGTVVLKGTIKK